MWLDPRERQPCADTTSCGKNADNEKVLVLLLLRPRHFSFLAVLLTATLRHTYLAILNPRNSKRFSR
eukprot:scaffold10157_cov142-Skeletonema_dohrnii-CCMP3373.AAC.27